MAGPARARHPFLHFPGQLVEDQWNEAKPREVDFHDWPSLADLRSPYGLPDNVLQIKECP
jgi:hypothetical protein